eukprot:scpid91484/ scgid21183/ Protein notum homolog
MAAWCSIERFVVVALMSVFLQGPHEARAEFTRYIFSDTEVGRYQARCLDGSPSGFFYERGALNTKWVFYLEGGGLCDSQETCQSRSHGSLGSSTKWGESFGGGGLLSNEQSENHGFYNWNRIYVPYCGGDLHSGQRTQPNEWNVYFSGHLTIVAIVKQLRVYGGIDNATDILVSGESAGGIGAFEHVDFFASEFPKAHVRGTPQGGYYFPVVGAPQTYQEFVAKQPAPNRTSALFDLYNASVNAACLAANPSSAFQCGPANLDYMINYLQTPVFVAENQFDKQQIFERMGCPEKQTAEVEAYIKYYGELMMAAMGKKVIGSSLGHGLYFPACLQHTGDLNNPY